VCVRWERNKKETVAHHAAPTTENEIAMAMPRTPHMYGWVSARNLQKSKNEDRSLC
jgi:hypothetical protein